MAQRKPFVPRPPRRRKPRKSKDIDAFAYAEFMRSLLVGNVRATKLIDTRDQLGRLVLAYDDPNG
jgi:hypothetical protein